MNVFTAGPGLGDTNLFISPRDADFSVGWHFYTRAAESLSLVPISFIWRITIGSKSGAAE
jgi:hypothetical protein